MKSKSKIKQVDDTDVFLTTKPEDDSPTDIIGYELNHIYTKSEIEEAFKNLDIQLSFYYRKLNDKRSDKTQLEKYFENLQEKILFLKSIDI